jgi:hypothetical protein
VRKSSAEPVAADEQRAVVFERDADQLDEFGIVGRVLFCAGVAVHLVAPRVAHGFGLGEVTAVLTLADGGMIVSDLLDPAAPDLVQPRISHVPDDGRPVFDHCHREDASHSVPLSICSSKTKDLIIGNGNGLADALAGAACLALETAPDHAQGNVRGFFTGGMPADSINHKKDAPIRVEVKSVLVIGPNQTRMGVARAPQLRPGDHQFYFC